MLRRLNARQTWRFHGSCLESTHLNGAPRDRPVHIIADNEVPIQDCVLLMLRVLLLGECWLEPDMCLEEQSKLKLKVRPTPPSVCTLGNQIPYAAMGENCRRLILSWTVTASIWYVCEGMFMCESQFWGHASICDQCNPVISVEDAPFSLLSKFVRHSSSTGPLASLGLTVLSSWRWHGHRSQKPSQLRELWDSRPQSTVLKTDPGVSSIGGHSRPTLVLFCEVVRASASSWVMKVLSVSKKLIP